MKLRVNKYVNNDRLALYLLINSDWYSDVTINLPDMLLLNEDEGFINGDINSINPKGENIIDTLKTLGIIAESYGLIKYNYGTYEHVKFNLEKIKEYDPVGVEDYLYKNTLEI